MKKTTAEILICFWVMWNTITVTKNEAGGMTYSGGMYMSDAADQAHFEGVVPGTYWLRSGLFYDTKRDCEISIKGWASAKQQLACFPDGVIPKSSTILSVERPKKVKP